MRHNLCQAESGWDQTGISGVLLSPSHKGNQQGTAVPVGSGALPGGRCNLVVPQWGVKREEVETRGCSPGESGSAESNLLHLPTSLCAAKMLKVSRKGALVITPAASHALPSLISLLDVMRKELCLMK